MPSMSPEWEAQMKRNKEIAEEARKKADALDRNRAAAKAVKDAIQGNGG